LRPKWIDFFKRWSDMHFLYGDKSVPYATEHHRPNDGMRFGRPAEYFHSSWLDPFFSYWCGIRVSDDLKTLTFDPFAKHSFSLNMVCLAGQSYNFKQEILDHNAERRLSLYDSNGNLLEQTQGQVPLTVNLVEAEKTGAVSATIQVETSSCSDNRRWSMVFTNAVPLSWDWTMNATRAELEIAGMNGPVTTNFITAPSNWVWPVFASDRPAGEDVYDLTLTFYNNIDVEISVSTAHLAVVTGAFGETPVYPSPFDPKWVEVRDNVVIPYDAAWTNATESATGSRLVIAKNGGLTQTNLLADASGYYGWKLKHSEWGYGTFDLALAFLESEGGWNATLTRFPDGIMVIAK